MTAFVIGVDPGGKSTGIVVRRGKNLLRAVLLQRDMPSVFEWAEECCTAVEDLLAEVRRAARDDDVVVAAEDLSTPSPHMGTISVRGLLDTAVVLGAIAGHVNVFVPPSRHGSHSLQAYPAELVGKHEKSGLGRLRHCRSAWDIAAAGEALLRSWGITKTKTRTRKGRR